MKKIIALMALVVLMLSFGITSYAQDISTNVTLQSNTTYDTLNMTSGILDLNGFTLTINGNFNHIGGNVILNGGQLIVKGDYLMQKLDETYTTSAELHLLSPVDYVLVEGNMVANSKDASLDDNLINGVIEIKGDLNQKSTYFIMSGNGKITLSGKSNQKLTLISSIGNLEVNNLDDTLLLNDKFYATSITSPSSILNINSTTGNIRILKLTNPVENLTLNINGNIVYSANVKYKNCILNINGNSIHDSGNQTFDGTTMNINGDWLLKKESGVGTNSKIIGEANESEVFVSGSISGDIAYAYNMGPMVTHVIGNVYFFDYVPNFGKLILEGSVLQNIDVKVYFDGSSIGTVIVNNPIGIRLKSGMGLSGLDSDLETINIYSTTTGFSLRAFDTIKTYKNINFYGSVYFSNYYTLNGSSFNFMEGVINITGKVIQDGVIRINDSSVLIQGDYFIELPNGLYAPGAYLSMQSQNAYLLVNGNLRVNGSVITDDYLKYGTIELKGNLEQVSDYFETGFDLDVVFSSNNEQSISTKSRISNIIIDNKSNSLTLLRTLYTNSISSPLGTATLKSLDGTVRVTSGNFDFLRVSNFLLNIKGNFVFATSSLGHSLVIENNGILNVENDMTIVSDNVFVYKGAIIVGNDLLLQREDGTLGYGTIREMMDESYIYVDGDFVSSGGTSYFEKGVLEVKGNLSFISGSRFFNEHYVLLTGSEPQNVDVYIISTVNKIGNLVVNKDLSYYQMNPVDSYVNLFFSNGNSKPVFPELPEDYLNLSHLGESHAPSGNYAYSETDMGYSAPGFDIAFGRTYNSNDPSTGLFGDKWHFSYESKISTSSKGDAYVFLPNGGLQVFSKDLSGNYVGYDTKNTLVKNASEYVLITNDYNVYKYDLFTGYLNSVTDKYGNKITLDISSDGKINSLTDQVGRTSTVSYGTNGLISKITDPIGREVVYNYTNSKLTSVVDPEGEIYFYDYDTNGYLVAIKDIDDTVLQAITYDHLHDSRVLTKTNALGNTSTYYYDDLYQQVHIIDSNGRILNMNYDSSLEITATTDPEGKTSTTKYNEDIIGRNRFAEVANTTDRNGNKTSFEYDAKGNVSKVTNTLDKSSQVVYDSKNNVIESSDVDGNKSYFIYDPTGTYLLKSVTPINGTDVYSGVDDKTKFIISTMTYYADGENGYLAKGLLKSTISSEGLTTTYTYDAYGNVESTTSSSSTVTNSNNQLGWTVQTTSPLDSISTFDYDSNGRLVRMINDSGHVSRIVYDNKGNKVQEISPNQYSASYDNLTTNQYSDSSVGIKTTYFTNGLVDTVTNAMGQQVSYTYDNLGNKLTETKPNGAVSLFEYDLLNRIVKVYFKDNASAGAILVEEYTYTLLEGGKSEISVKSYQDYGIGYTTTTTYDELGRVIKTINPDGSIYQTVYNENGTVQKEIDPKGSEVTYVYDKLGRVTETQVPFEVVNGTTYYSKSKSVYDNDSKVLSTESINSLPGQMETFSKTVYAYNNLGQVETITLYKDSAIENVTQYYYDAEGRQIRMYTGLSEPLTITGLDMVSGSDTDYSVTKSEYNNLGQEVKMINPMGYETTYTYDLNGNLVATTDPNGTLFSYEYDLNGNLLREYTTTLDGLEEIDYSYTYDNLGNRLSMVDSNKTTTYTYNERGQLVSEADTLGSEKIYTYDLAGNRKTMVLKFNNNTVQDLSYNYDNMGRLTEVLEGTLVKATYTYDINGNRSTLTYNNDTHTDYTYTLANSLKTITNNSNSSPISGETYTYYSNGNIFEKTDLSGRKTAYVYDDLNRLVSEKIYFSEVLDTTIIYAYDDYNNRTAKQVTTSTDSYSIMYYYDDMNRLESTYHSIDGTTTYTYDNNGNTLSEVSTAKTTTYEYNSLNELKSTDDRNKIVAFAYDGNRLRISKSVDGTTLQFLNDRDSVIAEILGTDITASYLRGINLISMSDPQGTFEWYYHYNYHGDVTELTDASGAVLKSYKYDAFGIEENIDPLDINVFRYTGEYFDKETGTIYLRARYYNPAIGRFLNQDSYLGNPNDPLSLNLYTYTHNNPVIYSDYTGNNPQVSWFFHTGEKITNTTLKIYSFFIRKTTKHKEFDLNTASVGNIVLQFDKDEYGIYHSNVDAWQQYGGYNDAYDMVFNLATNMKKVKYNFEYNGQNFILWGWKGDYLNLGAGTELGIYKKLTIDNYNTPHYLVDTDLALPMTLNLINTKTRKTIISNYSPTEPQWWITGFNPNFKNVKAENLQATYTVDFSGKEEMYDSFYNTYKQKPKTNMIFDDKNHKVTITF